MQNKEGASKFDKVITASSRFKPYETVFFEPPLVGLNGAKLTSYTWSYEWIMKPNNEGELVGKRISDWTQAQINSETGRNIVHIYTITMPDGSEKNVSSDTVPILMGYLDAKQMSSFPSLVSATKTLAKLQMRLNILEAELATYNELYEYYSKVEKPVVEYAKNPIPYFSPIRKSIVERNPDLLEEYSGFVMGDVFVLQDNPQEYNRSLGKSVYKINSVPSKQTLNTLEEAWIRQRVKDNGGTSPQGIWELRDKVARQRKKINQILVSEKNKLAHGGELSNQFDKGFAIENKEHGKTIEDVYAHKLTPKEAIGAIVKDHLKEDKHYYSQYENGGVNQDYLMQAKDALSKQKLSFLFESIRQENPDYLVEYIADQALGRTSGSETADHENAYNSTVRVFGKEAVDLSIKAFPLKNKFEDGGKYEYENNSALKDEESTAKGLEGKDISKIENPLSEKQFNKKYVAQHKDISGKREGNWVENKANILKSGLNEGVSVNALPIYNGIETNVIDRQYGNRKGDIVYILPKEGVIDGRNGYKTKKGYIPKLNEIVVIEYDKQPTYEAYKNQLKNKNYLSEAYHKAKADGSNPELVKAVEDLLENKFEHGGTIESNGKNYYYYVDTERNLRASHNYEDIEPYLAKNVLPIVTEKDYYISTKALFEHIPLSEYEAIDAPEFISISPKTPRSAEGYSSYKIKDGFVYRCSNHWGNVGTCIWRLSPLYKKSADEYNRNDFALNKNYVDDFYLKLSTKTGKSLRWVQYNFDVMYSVNEKKYIKDGSVYTWVACGKCKLEDFERINKRDVLVFEDYCNPFYQELIGYKNEKDLGYIQRDMERQERRYEFENGGITEAEIMQFGSGYKYFNFKRKNIPTDKIRVTEQWSLDEDFIEDIKNNGIKDSIIVQYDEDSDIYYVKNGNHRTLAAKSLGIKEIPCLVAERKTDFNNGGTTSSQKTYQEILQEKWIAAQDLNDAVGKYLKINSDGSVTVYHGTSIRNQEKILNERHLLRGAFFSKSKSGTKYGDSPLDVAKRKFGSNGVVMEMKVDARYLDSAAAGSEIYAENDLYLDDYGVWTGEKKFKEGGVNQIHSLPKLINEGWKDTTPRKTIKLGESKSIPIKDLEGSSQNIAIKKAANNSKKGNIPYIIDFGTLNSHPYNKYVLDDTFKRYGYITVEGDVVHVSPFKVGEKFDAGSKMETGGITTDEDKETIYKKWKSLVNMSLPELKKFYDSEEGKEAGLSKDEADELGIHSGRESARWIMKMLPISHKKWTDEMWDWAKRQIRFIKRMRGNKGKLYDDKGNKTRKHTSLVIWGHNPEKFEDGGEVDDSFSVGGTIKKLGHSGKKIEFVGANPSATFKAVCKWLEDKDIKYDYSLSRTTSSKYITFTDKNENNFKIRISTHTPALDDLSEHKGFVADGIFDFKVNSSFGYVAKDIENIIELVPLAKEKIESNEFLKQKFLDYPLIYNIIIRGGINDLLIYSGIENDEYNVAINLLKSYFSDIYNYDKKFNDWLINYKESEKKKLELKSKFYKASNGVLIDTENNKSRFLWKYDFSSIDNITGKQNRRKRHELQSVASQELQQKIDEGYFF